MRRINDGGYMKETIGNVLLNLDYYDGEDAYSDGSIEDRLLEIVKTTPKEDYQKVILTEKSWPIFYHLSPERENILDWYEWKDDASVFEVGAGCGAISALQKCKAGSGKRSVEAAQYDQCLQKSGCVQPGDYGWKL